MNWNEIWETLKIKPTRDKNTIRRAFAALSKECHMEDEPERFAKISEAYKAAMENVAEAAKYSQYEDSAEDDIEDGIKSDAGNSSEAGSLSRMRGEEAESAEQPPSPSLLSMLVEDGDDNNIEEVQNEEQQPSPSLLSMLEEKEEERLQKTFSEGALSKLIDILSNPKTRNSASDWKKYFLSKSFLDEQFDESFGRGLMDYLREAPDGLIYNLPKNFILELVIAYGLLPDAIRVGEPKYDKKGNQYWECIYRINGEGSFYNRAVAASLYNTQAEENEVNSKNMFNFLVKKRENRLRAYSFSEYIKLRKLCEDGHLNKSRRAKWEKMLLGGGPHFLYERNGQEYEEVHTHSECFVVLLEHWVRTDNVPESVLMFMYHSYGLKDIGHSSMADIYGGLKEAILKRLPKIEKMLYADDSVRERRKRWKAALKKIVSENHTNYSDGIYESTENIKKQIDDLFGGEDWEALKKDEDTFCEIYETLSKRAVTPKEMADFLLDFYEREGDFADPDKMTELRLGLIRSKNFIRRIKETDYNSKYVYEKTAVSDINADNEQFLVYLLSRGFGNRYMPVIDSEEKQVSYIKENSIYLSAFLDEIYHPFFTGDEQWNPVPGWQKAFTHFDEEENDILEPVRDEFTMPDGKRLTVEFHLHYILYFLNDVQVVDTVLTWEELKAYAEKITNPVHFLYLLAVTKIGEDEYLEAEAEICRWLEKTCIDRLICSAVSQLLACDNAGLPYEENEAKRVVAVCYGEQERFCFRMTVSRRNVKLYRQTRFGWEEMKLLDGEGKAAKSLDIEGKIDFCKDKLRSMRQPKPVLISRKDLSGVSGLEKIRIVIEAMKEGEIARRKRETAYIPGFPWRPDEITDSVREFFAKDGGWMIESYCVLHMGSKQGRDFDRVFWGKMNIFGFDLGFMSPEFTGALNTSVAQMSRLIKEKYLVVGSFGWGKRYTPKEWMEPMPLAIGESGTYYMYNSIRLFKGQSLEEVFLSAYKFWNDVTAVDVYEGRLTVSKFDRSLEYCYTQQDYQEWLDHKTTLLPEVFTKFGI